MGSFARIFVFFDLGRWWCYQLWRVFQISEVSQVEVGPVEKNQQKSWWTWWLESVSYCFTFSERCRVAKFVKKQVAFGELESTPRFKMPPQRMNFEVLLPISRGIPSVDICIYIYIKEDQAMKSHDRFLNFFLRLRRKSSLHVFLGDFTLPGLTESYFPFRCGC